MNWRMTCLKILLVLVCVINLALGIIAFTSEELILKVANGLYGVKLTGLAEHTLYIVKMLGCFLIAIAVMSAMAVKDPIKCKVVVYGNAIWLALRSIQRVTYIERFHQDWGLSYARLWAVAIFVFLNAAALFFLLPKKSEK